MHVFFKRHNAYDVRLKIFHCNYDVKLNSLHWYQIVCSAMSSFFVVEYGYVMVMGYLLNVVYDYFLCAHDSSEFSLQRFASFYIYPGLVYLLLLLEHNFKLSV